MPPTAVPVTDQVMVGDETNPALFFGQRYYERSGKSIPELLAIGIHTVRMAEAMNTKGIRGVDAWVYERQNFQQLTPSQIEPYLTMSESLDASILKTFRTGVRQ